MKEPIGERNTELLRKNGMNQRELADMAHITEVSLSRYISGDRIPKGPVIANIAAVLHTTSDYLLGQELEEDPETVYYQTQRAIARNAKHWTKKQKADLVNALFED